MYKRPNLLESTCRPKFYEQSVESHQDSVEDAVVEERQKYAYRCICKWVYESLPVYEHLRHCTMSQFDIEVLLHTWCRQEKIAPEYVARVSALAAETYVARRENGCCEAES